MPSGLVQRAIKEASKQEEIEQSGQLSICVLKEKKHILLARVSFVPG